MSTYKTFAVAGGTGSLGGKIVAELVAANYTVKVLSRSSSSTVPNAQVVGVDLEDHKSLTEALKGVDVVINALGQPSLQSDVQINLAKAAKVANVKLFIPNDWGADLHKALKDNVHPIHAFIAGKPKFHDYLEKELQLPWLGIDNGIFAAWIPKLFGADLTNRTASFIGKGDTAFTATSEDDIARFISLAFQHLPDSELQNRSLQVAGRNLTVNQLFKEAAKEGGKDWTFNILSLEEGEKRSKDLSLGAESFVAWLVLGVEKGVAAITTNDHERVHFQPKDNPVDFLRA